jgi:carbonic anhydrase/acetyltransferase-like protein (isoleucine patch superfamily)
MTVRNFSDKQPSIGEDTFIDESAQVIGEVRIGRHVSIWPNAVLRGDVHFIEVGAFCNIQDGCVLHVTDDCAYAPNGFPVKVGHHTSIAHRVVLHGCTVGNNCLIGINAVIMDGAVVADHVLVGAGSLVPPNMHLESGFLYVGSPVKKLRPLKPGEIDYISYSVEHYLRLKDKYLPAL